MSTYLVTGGAGFIGSHIVDELVRSGHKVRVLDNLCSGNKGNLKETLSKIDFIRGDIRDLGLVKKACRGADFILHQAALRSVPKSVWDPHLYNDVNITGTLNVLMAAHAAKVRRVVFASSSSVYGECKTYPQSEDLLPQLIAPYPLSKLTGEYYCRIFSKLHKLSTVSLRYFNVYGPRQSLESEYAVVVPKFITCMLKGGRPPVDGDGRQSRDFTYVADVVRANLIATACSKKLSGEVINIAAGKSYRVIDIVAMLNELMKESIKPTFRPPRPGDTRKTRGDPRRAKKFLGYEIKIGFEEGLKKTLEWFKNRY